MNNQDLFWEETWKRSSNIKLKEPVYDYFIDPIIECMKEKMEKKIGEKL